MKKIKLMSIVAVLLLCVGIFAGCGSSGSDASSTSGQAQAQDFKLNNNTGVEIYGVFVTPVGVGNWEEDIMGQDTLANGASVDISFASDKTDQYWDLMVTDSSGNNLTFTNLDLFTISEITLKLDNGNPVAETK